MPIFVAMRDKGFARRPGQAVRHERRAHLDLEEHPEHALTPAAGRHELRQHGVGVEVRLLALGVERHRGAGVGLAQVELPENAPRGGDVLLRHAAVRFRDVAHDRERGAEERRAHGGEIRARPGCSGRVAVVEMPENEAEQHAHRPSRQDEAQQRADQLSGPAHEEGSSFLDRPERAMLARARTA